jgi:hypothetical protein
VTDRPATRVAARVVAIAVPLAAGAWGITHPPSLLVGGVTWLVFLAAVLAGLGHLVERAAGVHVDTGLRMAWGAGLFLALAGVALAIGVLSYPFLGVCIVVGAAGYALREWTADQPTLHALGAGARALAAEPMFALFVVIVVAIGTINVVGSSMELTGNSYDDDVVYTPLVKRALDTGNIDEPFSFRRLSAYGGQTALGTLAAVRGTLSNIYLVDGGLFQLVLMLLVLGMARQRDRVAGLAASRDGPATDRFVVGFAFLVLVLLPNTSINTGGYWTAAAMFLALYRTAVLASRPDVRQVRVFAIVGGLAASACALRQNFLPVAVLFPLAVLVLRLGRSPGERIAADKLLWLATAAAGAVVLAPYCVASWRSNNTILFPIFPGTFNAEIPTRPTLFTWWQELQFFLKTLLETEPVRVMIVLLPAIFLVEDRRPGRPFAALTIAALVGFVLLVHNFTLSDPHHLWRYAFGYMLPLFLALVIDGCATGLRRVVGDDPAPVRLPLVARVAVVASLVVQLALSGRGLAKEYNDLAGDLSLAAASERHPVTALDTELLYTQLQTSAPTGSTIAFALDRPYYLDFARNDLINLDTPGFASYAPGMPFFQGAEPLARYFRDHGIRYVAFVRGEYSRYMYRREFWLRRIFIDNELWRVQGAYAIDCLDNFAALATTYPVLFERQGLVMLDLGAQP